MTFELDGVEDDSAPWLSALATSRFSSGTKVTSTTCPPDTSLTKNFAWADDGTFYFGSGYNRPAPLGTASVQGDAVTVTADFSIDDGNGGTLKLTGSGSLTLGTVDDDPLHGWRTSGASSCGWPQTKPAAFTGSYAPLVGDTLPDGVFMDQGGCGPCQLGSDTQKAFEDSMQALGVDTLVVSMLVPDYAKADQSPTLDDLKSFVTVTGTSGVALADRGFGAAIISSVAPGATQYSFGYPSYLLVAPSGKILYGVQGFKDTPSTWDDLATRIKTDAGK